MPLRFHPIPALAQLTYCLAACLALLASVASAADKPRKGDATTASIAYLQLADDPRYEEDRAYARNLAQAEGRPDAALDALVKESRFATSAVGVALKIERAEARDAAGLVGEINRLHAAGVRYFMLDAPGSAVAEVGKATRDKPLLLFNVSAADDSLRREHCQSQLLHTLPSHAMRGDAMAQFLVARKWRKVLLLQGPLPEDALIAAAFARAAKRFGIRIVETRSFVLSNDPRQREQGNPALLTANADYDAIYIADSDGEFARALPYRSVLPRPVVGAEGLVATAWHWAWERHGAPQLSSRFEKQAGRRMGEVDWATWVAGRAIVEAIQRTGGADFGKIAAYLRGSEIAIDGFKGGKLSFRDWNNQLRQPILIATHNAVLERAPIEGFMHQHDKLDTLGYDRPEGGCVFR